MKFTFTDSAIVYILKQINKFDETTYDIIIDYVDGNSPYNENIKWSKYDMQVKSNLGTVFFPSYYEMMFDKNNVFDYKNFTFNLKSEAGIIADQVQLIIKL